MEVIGDAKDVARLRPLAIAIPSKQGIVLMGRDSSPGTTNSRSEMPLCPAYRLCKESRGPYRPPMLDTEHDQQITMLHDLLQAIKEAALRLIQLITSVEVRRRKDADPRMHNPDSGRYESSQPRSPGSELIATTSSSVCALCGVALHLEDSSNESRRFVIDTERSDDYSHDISSKHLDFDNILKTIYEISLAAEKHKKGDNLSIPGSVLDYFFSKENDSIDMRAKGQEKKISSKTQSTDTSENGLKLLFVQQAPSDRTTSQIRQDEPQRKYDSAKQVPKYVTNKRKNKINESSHQCIVNISSSISSTRDASTLTEEMLCPCACGLLVKNESEVSINPMPISKDKLIKTKHEVLDLQLDSREMTQTKVHDNTLKIKKTKIQRLEKDTNVKRWIEEVVHLRLQVQIEELHKNILFFKQENEYIRRLVEKCRCLSEDIKSLQQLLPIRDTYSGLTTTVKHLQVTYHNEHGIIATLTGMFRGSINIQQIAAKLLSFIEHWNPRDNMVTSHVSSAPRTQAPLEPPSSMIFDVY